MCYHNMWRKRNPAASGADAEREEKKRPFLAVAVKCATLTDLLQQSTACDGEESRRGRSIREE